MKISNNFTTSIIIVVLGITLLFCVMFISLNSKDSQTKSKSNFEVVDTYKGCELLRWNNHQLAEYKYFLYCKDTKND